MTEHRADKYLKIESVLTADEKRILLESFLTVAPHQKGAHVADVLDMLDDYDEHCGEIDELWESGDVGTDVRTKMTQGLPPCQDPLQSLKGLFGPCWLACYYSLGRAKPTWPQVKALIERVQAAPPVL